MSVRETTIFGDFLEAIKHLNEMPIQEIIKMYDQSEIYRKILKDKKFQTKYIQTHTITYVDLEIHMLPSIDLRVENYLINKITEDVSNNNYPEFSTYIKMIETDPYIQDYKNWIYEFVYLILVEFSKQSDEENSFKRKYYGYCRNGNPFYKELGNINIATLQAFRANYISIGIMLLEMGGKIDLNKPIDHKDDGLLAFFVFNNKKPYAALVALKNGANPNLCSSPSSGYTLLFYISNKLILEMFAHYGANFAIKEDSGRLPYQWLAQECNDLRTHNDMSYLHDMYLYQTTNNIEFYQSAIRNVRNPNDSRPSPKYSRMYGPHQDPYLNSTRN